MKLQRFLFDMYDKRLEKGNALEQTVNDFLKEVKKRFNGKSANMTIFTLTLILILIILTLFREQEE